jgi:hypothetical protein
MHKYKQKKVVILSHDYDGCFSIMTKQGQYAELNGRNREAWYTWEKNGKNIEQEFEMARKAHFEFLKNITKNAGEVRVYVGSDRQSYALDQLNQDNNNNNGSVFSALDNLCKTMNTPKQGWIFETLLLADRKLGGNPFHRMRGEAYQRIITQAGEQLDVTDPVTEFTNQKGEVKSSKRPLLLCQMWDAYRQNPNATQLEFHFIDDRDDLIQDILEHLDPNLMPPTMTLVVSKFDYIGVIQKDTKAHGIMGQIQSTNAQDNLNATDDIVNEIKRPYPQENLHSMVDRIKRTHPQRNLNDTVNRIKRTHTQDNFIKNHPYLACGLFAVSAVVATTATAAAIAYNSKASVPEKI